MHGPVRWTVQDEGPTPLEDPVEDRGGKVVVVEYGAPCFEGLVRREDHGAVLQVAVVDDVVQHIGGVVGVGQVAEFIHDEYSGVRVGRQSRLEPLLIRGSGEIVDQRGGGHEVRIEAVLDCLVCDGNRQVGLAAARPAAQDQGAAVGNKLRREE